MNKALVVEKIKEHLKSKLSEAMLAADIAHRAAIDEQSIAETQYDTLAIEAAYLAEGQTRRILQFKQDLALMDNPALVLSIKDKVNRVITLGSLFSLEFEVGHIKHFYLSPAGASIELVFEHEKIMVITPSSPLGQAALGLSVEGELTLTLNNKTQYLSVITIS